MLLLAVPDGGDGDEGWRDGPLCEAEEETHGGEARVVLGSGEAHADDPPDDAGGED